MRIAMIGQKGLPARGGGVETHVHDLAVRLVSAGHEVTVYNRKWYAPNSGKTAEGVTLVQVPSLKSKHFDTASHSLLATFWAILGRYDVIHYHGVGPALFSWIPRLLAPKIRVVATFHSIDRKQQKWGHFSRFMLKLGERAICRFPHATITVSKMIQAYTELVYNREAVYIPNAVNSLDEKNLDETVLTKFGLHKNQYVLMVARLIPDKGAHFLIEAWKKIPAIAKDLKLVIVGDSHGTDSYVKELKSLAKTNQNILFIGHQEREILQHLYAGARLQVHPSVNEGLPLVVLEGMNHSLPILVSNIPAHTTILTNPEFAFQNESVDSLTKKLELILKKSSVELQAEGKSNKQIVRTRYTWDVIMKDVLAVYETPLAIKNISEATLRGSKVST